MDILAIVYTGSVNGWHHAFGGMSTVGVKIFNIGSQYKAKFLSFFTQICLDINIKLLWKMLMQN